LHLRQQRHGVAGAGAQGIRSSQGCSHPGELGREARLLTDVHSPFEQRERPGQVALAERQKTNSPRGKYKAPAVSNHLGNLQPFLPKGPARGECAQLGMALGEVGTGAHGRQESLAKALMAPRPLEGYHGLPEAVDRPRIVALSSVA